MTIDPLFSGHGPAIGGPDTRANATMKAKGDTATELTFVCWPAAERDDEAQERA